MITLERLEEMRAAELTIVQRPFMEPRVKRTSEELAEALGELIGRRELETEKQRDNETWGIYGTQR